MTTYFTPGTLDAAQTARERDTIERIGQPLVIAYPGHDWFVETDETRGVVLIRLPGLEMLFPGMTGVCGYIKVTALATDTAYRRQAMLVGGQLLEAYNVARRPHERGQYEAEADPYAGANEFSLMPGRRKFMVS